MVRACRIGVTCPEENVPEAVQRVGFQNWIADLAGHGQGLLKIPGSLLVAAEPEVSATEPGHSLGLVDSVTHFLEQGQGLPEVSGRVLAVAKPQVNNAEPDQCRCFAVAIADPAG